MDSSLLKKIPIFKGLTPSDFEKLETIIEEKEFNAGVRLFSTGDDPDAFYIIKSGSVRIVQEADGDEVELATLGEGDFFGEMGVLEGSPRMAAAIMDSGGTLLEVEAHEFHRFMAINPTISMKIMSTMSKRYRVKAAGKDDEGASPTGPGKVVSVFTATGGVGNSLIIANLAGVLKRRGKNVCILDCDMMFGDQVGIFSVQGRNSLSALVEESEIGYETLERIVEKTKAGIDLVPAPLRPEEAEQIVPDLVRVVVEVLKGRYDWVLIDTANSVAELNLTLLESADTSLYVMTPEFLALKNARRWFSILNLIGIHQDIQLVINKESKADVQLRDNIAKSLDKEILMSLPWDPRSAKRCLNSGELCGDRDSEAPLSQAFEELADKITGETGGGAASAGSEGGLLGRITSLFGG